MKLFTDDDFCAALADRRASAPRLRPLPPRKRITIADGRPTFGESQFDRDVRMMATSRRLFFAEVVQSAKARLDLLGNRRGTERLPCPWARFPDHSDDCKRCKGSGYTTVVCLRTHYQRMADEYARWA